jgi:hypothetical protein
VGNAEQKKKGEREENPSKRFHRCANKITLMACCLLDGQAVPPFAMHKAAKLDPRWEMNYTLTVNGEEVKAQSFATPSGGQTKESFRHWLEFVVLPCFPSLKGPWAEGLDEPPPERSVCTHAGRW